MCMSAGVVIFWTFPLKGGWEISGLQGGWPFRGGLQNLWVAEGSDKLCKNVIKKFSNTKYILFNFSKMSNLFVNFLMSENRGIARKS